MNKVIAASNVEAHAHPLDTALGSPVEALRELLHVVDSHVSTIRYAQDALGRAATPRHPPPPPPPPPPPMPTPRSFATPVRCDLPSDALGDVVRSLVQGSSHGFRLVVQSMFYNPKRPEHHCIFYPDAASSFACKTARRSLPRNTLLIASDDSGGYQARPVKAMLPDVIRRACGALLARLEDEDTQAALVTQSRVSPASCESVQTSMYDIITFNNAHTTAEQKKPLKKVYTALESEALSCITDPQYNESVSCTWASLLDKV